MTRGRALKIFLTKIGQIGQTEGKVYVTNAFLREIFLYYIFPVLFEQALSLVFKYFDKFDVI
jgi:hypothetical protein